MPLEFTIPYLRKWYRVTEIRSDMEQSITACQGSEKEMMFVEISEESSEEGTYHKRSTGSSEESSEEETRHKRSYGSSEECSEEHGSSEECSKESSEEETYHKN